MGLVPDEDASAGAALKDSGGDQRLDGAADRHARPAGRAGKPRLRAKERAGNKPAAGNHAANALRKLLIGRRDGAGGLFGFFHHDAMLSSCRPRRQQEI